MSNIRMKMRRLVVPALVLAAVVANGGCETTPVNPTPTPTTVDLFFTSQVMAGGVTTRSFTVAKAGEVKVLFTSLLPDSDVTISVGLGTFNGTTCTPVTTVDAKAGSTSHIITTTLTTGEFCLRVADKAVLTKTNDFSITVTIPAA